MDILVRIQTAFLCVRMKNNLRADESNLHVDESNLCALESPSLTAFEV